MRFRIDAAPVPPRRFRLPEGEHATAPAPLPELDKPVTPHVWGPGLATAADERRLAAAQKAAKRTPRRVLKAQMGAGGLLTVKAPVGPRKGRTVLDFVAASEYQMAGFMGTIQLRIDRDSVDLSRLENGLLSLAIDHDVSRLMGRVVEATVYPRTAGYASRGFHHGDGNGSDGGNRRLDAGGILSRLSDSRNRDAFRR